MQIFVNSTSVFLAALLFVRVKKGQMTTFKRTIELTMYFAQESSNTFYIHIWSGVYATAEIHFASIDHLTVVPPQTPEASCWGGGGEGLGQGEGCNVL